MKNEGDGNRTNSERVAGDLRKSASREFDLGERLLEFAAAIIDVSENLPKTRSGNHIAGQLLRAGTSPYGNHGEAESAESAKISSTK
jgi:hypothetical protein